MRYALVLFIAGLLFLSSCFKNHGPNENALLQQHACAKALELNDIERAKLHCELCLEYDKTLPECLNGLGVIALLHHDQKKAMSFFTKALRQNNDFAEARNNLGVIYFERGDFPTAAKYFSRCLKINPSNNEARYNFALSHMRIAQTDLAAHKKEEAIKKLKKAKDQFKKVLTIEPTYRIAYRDLGITELRLFDLSKLKDQGKEYLKGAKEAFANCLDVDDVDDACYEGLANVYTEQSLFKKAFSNYYLCLSKQPKNSACRKGIVRAYKKSAQSSKALGKFKEGIKNAQGHDAFCAALFEHGFDKKACHQCKQALQINPDYCLSHYRLAKYYATILDSQNAIKHCHELLKCDDKGSLKKENAYCQKILLKLKG